VESNAVISPRWEFGYDANAQLALVRDPKQRATTFTYDQLGRTLTHTLPMNQTASQSYDSYGRTFRKVDFKGQMNEFLYDSTGRLGTNRFYAAGSGVATNAVTYAYDSEDRTKQIFEPRGTNEFTYDNQGHVMQIASPEGAVNYEYEPIEGRRVRTYTANSDLRYGYDELGRVKTVTVMMRDRQTLTTPEVTTNNYTALGSLQDVYYPNGVHAAYQYDLMNRVTNVVNYNNVGGILSSYQYTVGTNGVVKAVTEVRLESGENYSTNQIAYTYDNIGRLVREASVSPLSEANYTNSYVYDLTGNLLWRTNGATGEIISYTYNTNDQLLVESSTLSGSFTNKYDTNGSPTNRASASESAAYVYDLQNRLTRAVINRVESGHNVAITASYTNNYAGLRVRSVASETVDGSATTQTNIFLFDTKSGGAQVLEELSAVGSVPTVSYTVSGKILTQAKGDVVSHLLSDGHCSTRLLTDSAGSITARYGYDAYGKMLGFSPGVVNQPVTAVLYSGEHLDKDLQQYNSQARYYNPGIGRFSAIDPFSPNQQSGANLYAYCADDPINNSDPSGLYEIDVHQFLTQFLAEKAGFGAQPAKGIGKQTQALDAPGDPRAAMINGLPNHYNMEAYHFVSRDRLSELWSSAYFWGKPNGQLELRMGEYFHALQDTYGHCTGIGDRNWDYYGSLTGLGHGLQGHEPDHTWRDVEKGMKMAVDVYSELINFSIVNSSPNNAPDPQDWTAIRGKVETFMLFQPNVYKEANRYLGQNFYVENATFDGYTAKIHQLDTGYKIDQIYADKGIYLQVAGQRPSTTVFGATIGATIEARIVPAVFDIGLDFSMGLAF
jgi:RHS repeat-associated protein